MPWRHKRKVKANLHTLLISTLEMSGQVSHSDDFILQTLLPQVSIFIWQEACQAPEKVWMGDTEQSLPWLRQYSNYAMGCGPMSQGLTAGRGKKIFCSPQHLDWLRGHPASYPVGTRGHFAKGKATWVWSWPFTSTQCQGYDQWNNNFLTVPMKKTLPVCDIRFMLEHCTFSKHS
jgi:hypothetical protein